MTPKKNPIKNLVFILSIFTLLAYGCAGQSGSAPPAEPAQAPQPVSIRSIAAAESADGAEVTIAADGPVTFSSFKKPDPPAVVLILPATDVSRLSASPVLDSALIRNVAVSAGNGGQTARIEFQLAADAAYTARQQDNNVLLTFNKTASAQTPAAEDPAPVMASAPQPVEEPVAPAAMQEEMAPAQPAPAAVNVPKTTAWVNKVDFLSEAQGKSTLVLGTTHAVDYRINKTAPQKIEIRLLNTRIPSYRQRALITTRFSSAVDRVVPYQQGQAANETIVSVELRESVPYYAEQTDNLLMVHFEASSVPPKPMEQAQLPAWKQSMAMDGAGQPDAYQPESRPVAATMTALPPASEAAVQMEEAPDDLTATMMQEDRELRAILAPRKTTYTGEKIALDFYDTDIKNVFRILREVSGKNFAIDKDVSGKVTMTLDQPVPWDQVLDLVLRMNQLGMTHEGSIVRIATLETLKKEDDLRKAKLESLRKARDEAKALEPLVTKYIPVSYSNAEGEVKPHIEKILTDGRGSVTVDGKNNQIIVTDTIEKVRQAEEIIRRIDKVTAQVIIEARVVEVSQEFSRQLGVKWGLSYGEGVIGGSGINTKTDVAMDFPTASTSGIGMSFSRFSGVPFVLNAQLDALETTGKGRILSSPKILTLDNKKAKIKQGLQFAYLERDDAGGSSVKFKDIDLLLEVTPHVTPDDRISMEILLTKNDVDSVTAEGVPSIATNEAETELLVNDGDTVVIGGIVKKTESGGQTGFPLLSKIPVLGWAFKNKIDSTTNDELLIFITPRIVQLEQQVAGNLN